MRYLTQTLPCIDNDKLVEFYVHDTETHTIEKVTCVKKVALAMKQIFRELNAEHN